VEYYATLCSRETESLAHYHGNLKTRRGRSD